MMKEDYIRRHLHNMAMHCHSAALGIGRIERTIQDYGHATRQQRQQLDERFKMQYASLARMIGEKKALHLLDEIFRSPKVRARAY